MSASPAQAATEPKDTQERRLRLKREAVALGGELAAHGARVELGKVTQGRAVVEVRQEKRVRQDIIVTIEEGAPVYTLAGDRSGEEFFDALAVRQRIVAPPDRWNRLWWVAVSVTAWVLMAIGWAISQGSGTWYILTAIVVAGTVLTLAGAALGARGVRAARKRKAMASMTRRR